MISQSELLRKYLIHLDIKPDDCHMPSLGLDVDSSGCSCCDGTPTLEITHKVDGSWRWQSISPESFLDWVIEELSK